MLRKLLFYAELLAAALIALCLVGAWMAFAGPQMHVAETFAGLLIALVAFLLMVFSARRRYRRREAAALELRRAAEMERKRLEEEERLRAAWEEEMRIAEREARWQAEREERLKRATERARRENRKSAAATETPEASATKKFDVRAFIDDLLSDLSEKEQRALSDWLSELLQIRELGTNKEKLSSLGTSLRGSRALAPVAKTILIKLKKHGWDDLGGIAKWTVGAGGSALLLFGGAGAGIAAFGGAIGVPLFIVFGAGGALAGTIIQEIDRRSKK